MRCPFCQETVTADANFCGHCGHPLPKPGDEDFEGVTLVSCSPVGSETVRMEPKPADSALLPAPQIVMKLPEEPTELSKTMSQNAPMPKLITGQEDSAPVHVLVVPKQSEPHQDCAPLSPELQGKTLRVEPIPLTSPKVTAPSEGEENDPESRISENISFCETAWFKDGVNEKALAENELSGSDTLVARYRLGQKQVEPSEHKEFSLKNSIQPFGSSHHFGEEVLEIEPPSHLPSEKKQSDWWVKLLALLAVVCFCMAIWWVLS